MLRFRPKLGSELNREWRCFFCLHVRTGTILLGSWHLMLHLVALGFLAAVVRDPNLMEELDRGLPQTLPTPLANIETQPSPYTQHASQPRDHTLVYMCTLAITLMLIYGASRGKPAHLLPFFCLQVFDFAITVLTATGYLCYVRSIHRLLAEAKRVPWHSELMRLPAPALAFLVLATFLISVLIKAYCINVVWRCYKYLTMRAHALHSLTPFVISSSGAATPAGPLACQPPAPDYSSLLPDYEEAVKQTPPPSYRAATLATAAPEAISPDTPPAQSPARHAAVESPKAAPLSPELAPQSPQVAPQSPQVAPQSPQVAPQSPQVAPQSPQAAPPANTIVMLPQGGDQARV